MKHKALGLSATAHGEFSRRDFIRGAAALDGAAMMGGLWSGAARAAGGALETSKAKLGFIALTDAAPLFVADEKGFFARHGMTEVEVTSSRPGAPPATTWCSARRATASTAPTSSPPCPI